MKPTFDWRYKTHLPYQPRFVFSKSRHNLICSSVQYPVSVGRRLQPNRVATLAFWLGRSFYESLMGCVTRDPYEDLNLSKKSDTRQSLICSPSSRTVSERSSSMERKLITPSCPKPLYLIWPQAWKLRYRTLLLTVALLCVVSLMSMRPTALEFSATSLSRLTVTISSLHELSVNVLPTSLWIVCGNLESTFCLQDQLIASSDYLIFKSVFDSIAFSFVALNLEFDKLFYLVTT